MRKRVAQIAAVWLAAALLVAVGITAALSLLGNGIFGPSTQVLSQARVRQELADHRPAAPSRSASPSPSASHPSSPAGAAVTPTVKRFPGGVVYASCSAGQVTLRWVLAQGYETDGSAAGPAASAFVRFRSGTTEEVVTVTCPGNHLAFSSSVETAGGGDDRHGGGGSGRDGGGHGGGDG